MVKEKPGYNRKQVNPLIFSYEKYRKEHWWKSHMISYGIMLVEEVKKLLSKY